MSRAFEDSSLWRTAFGPRTKDKHADQRKFLEIAYRQFREAVLPLLRQTAIDLPALTIHDETHVDQLWDVASEICGTDYPLNPLEAFVVGGAFLLHDSALCVAAYENSVLGLMRTDEWRDSVARLWRTRGVDSPSEQQKLSPPEDLRNAAIFEVLRHKHSQQASILIDRSWKHPVTGRPILLLENAQLQEDYGKLIGQIAASHHWQIKLVEDSFPTIIPASTNWPREWELDPLKLACILRCSDAAAIDDRRAPSRLFAFRTPTDTARRHWAFQNNLYPASLEQETLVFISKMPFDLASMDDWWLCFDAVNIVDEELRASNAALTTYNRAPFAARQAFGANVAEDFQKKVSVRGWTPVETSLRVSDIPSIIRRFGGTKLYGNNTGPLFRELIQNGADAIRARRRRDSNYRKKARYPGRIRVHMRYLEDNKTIEVSFEDDGIGMSPSVLTGPMLDFGSSFWNTELAAILYPGLQSDSEFRPAGKYGIGFFSAFMFSDQVTVLSRPFTKGNDDLFALIFKNGLTGRAQLRQYDRLLDGEVIEQISTMVKAHIPIHRLFASLEPSLWFGEKPKSAGDADSLYKLMHAFLSKLCFALDVAVEFEMRDGSFVPVNEPHYADWSNEKFLTNLDKTFLDGESLPSKLSKCVEHLVNEDGRLCGRACISINYAAMASIDTIDGFARNYSAYVSGGVCEGVSEETASVASRREGEPIATPSAWSRWALKQLDHLIVDQASYTPKELYFAATHLAELDINPAPIARCYLVDRLVPLVECLDLFKKKKKLMFLVVRDPRVDHSDEPQSLRLSSAGSFCRAIDEELGVLIEPEDFVQSFAGHHGPAFERISSDFGDATGNNILSCFLGLLNKNGIRYSVSFQPNLPIGRYSGFATNWIGDDEIVKANALVVSLESSQRRASRKR